MRKLRELKNRIKLYKDVEYIYDSSKGYIVWHLTTGDNVEMLFIEVAEKRKGYGHYLYRLMAQTLISKGQEPYHSVIGYRLASNKEAGEFYNSLGFTQVDLGQSIYRGDHTILMWVTWTRLREILGV